ncbi:MAG: hypothetical protein ABEJ96_10925, partial [Thiohalorhabdaceae bacterium]
MDAAPCPIWTQALEESWDLVVLLDAKGQGDWPYRIQGVRVKVWDLADSCPAAADGASKGAMRQCRDALRERVERQPRGEVRLHLLGERDELAAVAEQDR